MFGMLYIAITAALMLGAVVEAQLAALVAVRELGRFHECASVMIDRPVGS